jgi:hypothetical protein
MWLTRRNITSLHVKRNLACLWARSLKGGCNWGCFGDFLGNDFIAIHQICRLCPPGHLNWMYSSIQGLLRTSIWNQRRGRWYLCPFSWNLPSSGKHSHNLLSIFLTVTKVPNYEEDRALTADAGWKTSSASSSSSAKTVLSKFRWILLTWVSGSI